MIQDIKPNIFYNEFNDRHISEESRILIFKGNEILLKHNPTNPKEIIYPTFSETSLPQEALTFLFKINDTTYFLGENDPILEENGYAFESHLVFRNARPRFEAFAGFTAYHLYCWYRDTKFCGRCGSELKHYDKERAMKCDNCSNIIYPKICPAVIVGVIDGDKLIMTKYAQGYKKYALIAGFNEIGESIERTVEREVMEEVGLKVKNLTYYKSQPWGISSSLLMGFFCEVDGDNKIKLDETELKEGKWFTADEIDPDDNDISLTREMIVKFKTEGRNSCLKINNN